MLGNHKHRRVLFRMVAAGVLLRLCVAAFLLGTYLDPQARVEAFDLEGANIARSIAAGQGFSSPLGVTTGPTAWRGPVHPYILALWFRLFGAYSIPAWLAMVAFNSLCSALTCVPLFRIAQMAFGERAAHWAGWAWAFFPYAILQSVYRTLDGPVAVLLLACGFWHLLRLRDSTRATDWAAHGLLWGVAVLTHPAYLAVLPLWWVWLWWQTPRNAGRLKLAGALAATFVITVTPWLARNYAVFGQFVFLRSNLGLELAVGNRPGLVEPGDRSLHPAENPDEARHMQEVGEIAYMAEKKALAFEFIREHPGEFARLTARRVSFFWTHILELNLSGWMAKPFETANIPFCALLTVLGFAGLWRYWQHNAREALAMALFLAAFPLVYYVTLPNYRYRHPVDPFLVVLATGLLASRGRVADVPGAVEPH